MPILERDPSKIARGAAIAWWAALIALVAGMIATSADSAIHLNPIPMDGTFHLFNPVRRMMLGQVGGIDYQNYHGIVLPYLYYPAFRLGGFTLFSLELTRNLYSTLALVIAYVVMFAVLTRSAERTVRLTVAALLASYALQLMNIITPGASEFGVRTFFPVMFAAMLAVPSEPRTYRLRALAEGMLLGLFVAISTEQGIALAAAYGLVAVILAAVSNDRAARVARLAGVAVAAVSTFAITLMMIGGPRGMLNAVAYNFGAVSEDQFWYFGTYPSAFLAHWVQFVARPRMTLAVLLAIANAVFWVRRLARRRVIRPPRAVALAVLSLYGLLSTVPLLARWVTGYVDNADRILIIVALFGLDLWLGRQARRGEWAAARRRWMGVVALLLAGAVLVEPRPLLNIVVKPYHVAARHIVGGERPALSAPWQRTLEKGGPILARHRHADGSPPSLWSTYSSVFEATTGALNPSFDYTIDALGHVYRPAYVETFRKTQPEVVQTLNPMYSAFEEWLEVTTWDLYRELLTRYWVAGVGPWSVFWERLPQEPAPEPLLLHWEQPPGGHQAMVEARRPPGDAAMVFDVEVDYEISNPWRAVPLLGKLPRFEIVTGGAANSMPIPLAPYATHVSFPLVMPDTIFGIKTAVESLLPGASITLRSVTVRAIPLHTGVLPWIGLFLQGGVGIPDMVGPEAVKPTGRRGGERLAVPIGAPLGTRLPLR